MRFKHSHLDGLILLALILLGILYLDFTTRDKVDCMPAVLLEQGRATYGNTIVSLKLTKSDVLRFKPDDIVTVCREKGFLHFTYGYVIKERYFYNRVVAESWKQIEG